MRNANGSLSEVGPDNFIDFFIHNTDIVGTLISADGSQQDNFFVYGDQPTATFVAAIDSALPDSLVVQIGADANEGSGFGSVLVVRHLEEAPCPVVSLAKQQLSPGDTVAITIMGKKADNTIVPYPASQLFNIGITAGSGYALIHSTAKGLTNASFDDTPQPFQLVVNDTITVDSVVVQVGAVLSNARSGGGAAPDRSPILAQAKVQGKIGTAVRAVKFLAAFLSDACALPASGVVKKKQTSAELIIVNPTTNTTELRIDESPKMPTLEAKAQLKNFNQGQVTFSWSLTVHWVSLEPRVFHDVFRGTTTTQNSDISTWVLPWNGKTRGGEEIVLHVTATADGKDYDAEVVKPDKILGDNPSIAQVKEGLSLQEQVTVYLESSPKWKQFRNDGFPSFGGPHGYGLMQLDDPRATDEQVWNWRENRAAGVALLAQKRLTAASYTTKIRDRANLPLDSKRYLPPGYKGTPDFTDDELIIETFQEYNGGRYWFWQPDDSDDPESVGEWIVIAKVPKGKSVPYGTEAWKVLKQVIDADKGMGTYPPNWN